MKKGIKNVVKNIVDGFFPPLCRGCGASGECLCERCKNYISEMMRARRLEGEGLGDFSGAVYLGFRDEILGEMIEEAKYESVRGLIPEIAEVVWRGYFKEAGMAILVPMPTNRKHVRERAMDHMDMICEEIARMSEGKVRKVRLLERRKDTVQVGASETVRRRQAKEAVGLNPKYFKDGKVVKEFRKVKVVLVDDVWTTGASLTEAGKMLKKAGVADLSLVAITKNRARKSPVIRRGEIE